MRVAKRIGEWSNASMENDDRVLALVRDLMFSSKIIAEARAAGIEVNIVRDPARLRDQAGRRLLVDLNLDGALDAASEWKNATGGNVIGFVSHVDTATIERAKQAGLDEVMPRSKFTSHLPDLMRTP